MVPDNFYFVLGLVSIKPNTKQHLTSPDIITGYKGYVKLFAILLKSYNIFSHQLNSTNHGPVLLLNPLSPTIHIQILQTDLYTFH